MQKAISSDWKLRDPEKYDSFSLRRELKIKENFRITLRKPGGDYPLVIRYERNDEWRDDPSWEYLDSLNISANDFNVIELGIDRMKNGEVKIWSSGGSHKITREDLKSINPDIIKQILCQVSTEARSLLEKLLE